MSIKGNIAWNQRPYIPYDREDERLKPYICKIAPFERGAEIEILDCSAPKDDSYIVKVRALNKREAYKEYEFSGNVYTIDNLEPNKDYEFFVERKSDLQKSLVRLFRTGFYPDVMVNYNHPKDNFYSFSGRFPSSPTIVKLPSGRLIAGMDIYEKNAPQNLEILFSSDDMGKTWRYLTDLFPAYWGLLFVNKGVLYMLGTTQENGHVVIGASYDEGLTWTKPVILFLGGSMPNVAGFQRQPAPITFLGGKIITSIEFGAWGTKLLFGVGTMFANEDSDLLDPKSWTVSSLIHYDQNFLDSPKGKDVTFLEGSIYQAKDNKLINLLRLNIQTAKPNHGKACLLELDINNLEAAPKFLKIIDMPTGSNSRTHVLQDPKSCKYFAIGNYVDNKHKPRMRNIMALSVSDDGYNFKIAKIILDYKHLSHKKVGFQYTSFIFDRDNILYLTRTAFNGADTFHNANCQTFGVIKNFRSLGGQTI
jgi:hypothetical protein